jgi:hypothetical protein
MAIDPITPTSRRALLAGAAGGLTAAVVGTLSRAQPASAHDPDDVRLGGTNSTGGLTSITNTANNGFAFHGTASGQGVGVTGVSDAGQGVYGQSSSGIGVWGNAPSGTGVFGGSNSSYGVSGNSGSSYGVFGFSDSGDGVYGQTSSGNGVHGKSSSASASGVYGENQASGYGVAGRSSAPALGVNGIYAAATLGENTGSGIGVWARSQHGVGLYADAVNPDAIALRASGVTVFTRSGRLTVKAGVVAVTKTGIRIDAGTLVLATLQQDRPGVFVRSAVPNAAGNSFTIRLNMSVDSDTKVGWFLVN